MVAASIRLSGLMPCHSFKNFRSLADAVPQYERTDQKDPNTTLRPRQ
jgi:hypothetical protein